MLPTSPHFAYPFSLLGDPIPFNELENEQLRIKYSGKYTMHFINKEGVLLREMGVEGFSQLSKNYINVFSKYVILASPFIGLRVNGSLDTFPVWVKRGIDVTNDEVRYVRMVVTGSQLKSYIKWGSPELTLSNLDLDGLKLFLLQQLPED